MRPPIHRDGRAPVRGARAQLTAMLTLTALAALTVGVAQAQAPAEPNPVSVYHHGCYERDCTVQFTFSEAMVKTPKKGTLKGTGPVEVTFKPEIKGKFHWKDAQNLVFTPAKGAMNWGREAELEITRAVPLSGPANQLTDAWRGWIQAPNFYAAGKTAWWPVVEGQPRFVAFLNDRSGLVGKGALYMLYDQPVTPSKLKSMISARAESGQPLPISVTRPRSVARVWSEGGVDLKHVVALKLRRLPEADEKVHLALPTWGEDGPTFSNHTLKATRDFTALSMQIDGAEDLKRVPMSTRLTFRFDRPVRTETLQRYLDISPKPESMSMWSWDGEITAYVDLAPGTRYSVRLRKGMPDVLGNTLTRGLSARFRTADLPPRLLISQQELLLEPGVASVPVDLRNVEGLTATAHPVESAEAFLAALDQGTAKHCGDYPGVDAVGQPIPLPRALSRARPLNDEGRVGLPLPSGMTGLYCINLTAGTRGTEAAHEDADGEGALVRTGLVQIADMAATVKVGGDETLTWITSLKAGAPLAGAEVQLIERSGKLKAGGFTDAHGVVRLPTPGALEAGHLMTPMYLVARHEGQQVLTLLTNEHLSRAWQFGLPGPVAGHVPLKAAVFTERGVYRPGETVHSQIVAPAAAQIPGAAAQEMDLAVLDARGRTVFEEAVALDGFGVGALEIPLKETASTGTYTLKVSHEGATLTRRFLVEEYRVPTFAVTARQVGKKAPWKIGKQVKAEVEARYLHGGRLAGRSVKYTVDRVPVSVSSAAFPQFTFGGGLSGGEPLSPRITEGEGVLDEQGRVQVSFKIPKHASPSPQRYVLWAEVTDVDRQAYAGRLAKVVHPTDLYVGTQLPSRGVIQAGRAIEVPVAAVDTRGRPKAGVRAKVTLEQVEHRSVRRLGKDGSVRWLNHTTTKRVKTCRVRTAKVARRCDLTVPKAGRYRIRVAAKDGRGRPVTSGFEFTAIGMGPVVWPRFDQDKITVVADKAGYAPGDVARLVVESPYERAWALATLEHEGVRWHKAFQIDGDTPAIDVPISPADAPDAYAAVTLVRGRQHRLKDGAGLETGAPAFKIGYARLKVDPADRRLQVQVTPQATTTAPGSEAVVDLEITDHVGNPVEGQAVVMAVDEAVLGLTAYRTPDPVAELFSSRPLAVRTGEGRLELPQARIRRYALSPAGDGGDGAAEMKVDPTQDNLRNLFETTAFVDAKVKITAGRGRVRFTLPDNLTTYRVMAVVVDGEGRTGSDDAGITLRKPLMVSPVVPRFVYPDDTLTVEALVYNATEGADDVVVSARFEGMVSAEAAIPASHMDDGLPTRRGRVGAESTSTFGFPVRVLPPAPSDGPFEQPQVKIELIAQMGDLTDRVQLTVPVLDPGSARAEVASAMVQGQSAEAVRLTLPEARRPGTGQIELNVSTTSLTRLSGAVDYLMGYPNGCIEQTTSRAYPLVMLDELLPEMGVKVDPAKLKEYAAAGVKRLLSFQTPAGGLSYWPGSDTPHAFGTAFGLTALIEARKKGYDVPDQALARMADYLERALRKGKISGEMPHGSMADGDTRALFVMTLGRLGRTQVDYIQTLWRQKGALTPFGLSFLATAIVEAQAKGEDKGTAGLLGEILATIEQKAARDTDEAWYEGKAKGGWSFDSALRTHAAALLAFSGTTPSDLATPDLQGMSGKLLNGLLNRQKYGLWGNTQENVFGIMGVARYVGLGGATSAAPTGDAGPQFELRLGDWAVPLDALEVEKLGARTQRVVISEAKVIEMLRSSGHAVEGNLAPSFTIANPGGKPLTVTARADYQVELKPEDSAPVAKGLTVRRSYSTLGGRPIGADELIPLGDVVRVRVEVDAKALTHYVAIDDKLPAGLEPMNAAFANSAPAQVFGERGPDKRVTAGLKVLSHHEIRDSRVAFYVDEMPEGKFAFTYLARATTPGVFRRPAARAEAMYDPETVGLTAIDRIVIAPNEKG